MKYCSVCHELKPDEEFRLRNTFCVACENIKRRKRYQDNKQKVCTQVKLYRASNKLKYKEIRQAYRKNNPDKIKERAKLIRTRKREEIKNNPAKYPHSLVKEIRCRAKLKKLPFDLKVSDIVIPTHCPALGVLLTRGTNSMTDVTVDRLIPKLGYVKGNIIIVSRLANQIKSCARSLDIYKVAQFYETLGF